MGFISEQRQQKIKVKDDSVKEAERVLTEHFESRILHFLKAFTYIDLENVRKAFEMAVNRVELKYNEVQKE